MSDDILYLSGADIDKLVWRPRRCETHCEMFSELTIPPISEFLPSRH